MYSLSIIIPFIDELNSLKKTLKIISSRNKVKKEFLIIISKRKTSYNLINKLKNLKKKYNLKIYCQKRPFVGGAVKTGIKFSKNSHIVIMASDLETNPYDLKKMISISKKNLKKIICANRWHLKSKIKNYGFIKKILNFLFQKALNLLFKSNLI